MGLQRGLGLRCWAEKTHVERKLVVVVCALSVALFICIMTLGLHYKECELMEQYIKMLFFKAKTIYALGLILLTCPTMTNHCMKEQQLCLTLFTSNFLNLPQASSFLGIISSD